MIRKCYVVFLAGALGLFGLMMSGCSEGEAPQKERPKKVVFKIERPKKQRPIPEQSPKPTEKAGEIVPKEIPEKPDKAGMLAKEDRGEKPQPASAPPLKKEGDAKEKASEASEAKIAKSTQARTPKKPEQEQQVVSTPEELVPKGVYVTEEGESLFTVSGTQEVYSDPFKWPCLLWLNPEILKQLGRHRGLEHKELSAGTKIRFYTRDQIEKNLERIGKKRWVINLVSDKTTKSISPLAVKLVRGGVPVYIVRSKIKGEIWFRLRTGFFTRPSEAEPIKQKIGEIARVKGVWLSKISEQELKEYGGLIPWNKSVSED